MIPLSLLILDKENFVGIVSYPGEFEIRNVSRGHHELLLIPIEEGYNYTAETSVMIEEEGEIVRCYLQFEPYKPIVTPVRDTDIKAEKKPPVAPVGAKPEVPAPAVARPGISPIFWGMLGTVLLLILIL